MARFLALLSALILTLPTDVSAGLRGGWNTSGAPAAPAPVTAPYDPAYKLEYVCQIEVSNNELYGNSMIVAAHQFKTTSTSTWITDFAKLDWKYYAVTRGGTRRIQKPSSRVPFEDHTVSLQIYPSVDPAVVTDQVALSVGAAVVVGGYRVSKMEYVRSDRAAETISASATVGVPKATGAPEFLAPYLSATVFVSCDKKR